MHAETDYRKYLDPRVLARISSLELRARMIVEGCYAGAHRSPFRGLSVEFADHRAYSQGDDIRHIDWRLFGRTDKHYVKQFEQETNLDLVIAVDCSESMSYTSDATGWTKHDYASSLAAALGYLALHQRDAVGLALFDNAISRYLKPSNHTGHWRAMIHELAGKTGPAKTSLRATLDDLAGRIDRRSLIVIVSDLFDNADGIVRGLKHLKYRRHDLVVFQVLDNAEITFPFRGPVLFEGLERAGRLLAEPRSLRVRYIDELEHFTSRIRSDCRKMNIDFVRFDTSLPLDDAISTYLATRAASIRSRTSRVMGGR